MKYLLILFAFTVNAQTLQILMSDETATSGNAYVTDSLKHYWVIDSLADGSVDEWFDAIRNYRVAYETDTTQRPIKIGENLIFGGNDYLRGTTGGGTLFSFAGQPMTIEMVCEIVDTTGSQLIFGVRNTSMIAVSLYENRISVWFFDGTNYVITNCFSTPFLGKHHILITWDGVGTSLGDVYLDNVLQADVGDFEGAIPASNRVFIGGADNTSEVANGTDIPLLRVYNLELNETQRTTNYNSDSVQGLLP